jgi:hypothetical protein
MNVCVFCGSSFGNSLIYEDTAKQVGDLIASTDSTLIYGGGKVGLMGAVADAVILASGKAIGVIPDFLYKREVAHIGLTELHIVSSMHERKMKMADLADVFIALPGGLGTLDELVEILTWKQLGLINKPVALLNTNSYFDFFILQLKKMSQEGFLQEASVDDLIVKTNPNQLFSSFLL